jgi:hypothetical protein
MWSWAWWWTSVILALWKLRQEEANLGDCFKKQAKSSNTVIHIFRFI